MTKTDGLRQRYLAFLGKLYSLAAEFPDEELTSLKVVAKRSGEVAANLVIDGMLLLHHRAEPSRKSRQPRTEKAPPDSRSLRAVLMSTRIFRSNEALVEAVGKHLKVAHRPKESREKLANRILKILQDSPAGARQTIGAALEQHLRGVREDPDFVSRWTEVIKKV